MIKEFGYLKILFMIIMLIAIFITGESHFGFLYEF